MVKDRIKYYFISLILITGNSLSTLAGNPPVVKWVANHPFEQKVFIENNGQYSIKDVNSKDILFGARQGGLQYYFTRNSIWIKRIVTVKRTEKEMENLEPEIAEKDDDNELKYKITDEFHEISLTGVNPSLIITPGDEVSWYYNFTIKGNVPVKANAFKELTYQNIYPGIDMKFYFPEDKEGFEYYFILHPGADVSQIQINYPSNKGISYTKDGNIIIESDYGPFINHAPYAYEAVSRKAVDCAFTLKSGVVEFNMTDYDKAQSIIIDPWVSTPAFTGTNSAYDLDWDNTGNCYVYGGNAPWQLIKYNSKGVMIWSYTESFDTIAYGASYGGFAVDHNSQSAYIIQGAALGPGNAKIQKINSTGAIVTTWGGDYNFNEIWRIVFDYCTNQVVVAGGGTTSPTYTGYYLDTTMTNFTGVNMLNYSSCCDDMWGITLDRAGNYAYIGTLGTSSDALFKVDLPSLSSIQWNVVDGYDAFSEKCCSTFGYAFGIGWGHVGYNGVATSNNNLYSYDSHVLKQWDLTNGNLNNSVNINGANINAIDWGGIASDQCDNVFLADSTNILQYNVGLKLVNTISGNNTIYDVKLSSNNILYACGDNFVEAIEPSIPNCYFFNVQNQIHNPTCLNPASGSDMLTISNGIAPYTINWNTTPMQTGNIISGLSTGEYIATITDAACPPETEFDTIVLSKFLSILNGNQFAICTGDSITISVSDTVGVISYVWSPSIGLSSISESSVVASPTTTTTYTLVATLSGGCSDTARIIVKVNPLPVINLLPDSATICLGDSASILAGGANNYVWSPYLGLSKTSGSLVTVFPTSSTLYSIVGTDGNGCINSVSLNINVAVLSVSPSSPICDGQSTVLIASGMKSYKWYPPTGLNITTGDSVVAMPVANTTYTVTGSEPGCPNQETQAAVTIIPSPNKPTFRQHGDTLISSSVHDNQWYRNDTLLDGDTTKDLIITEVGDYWVNVINEANGCGSPSDTVKIDSVTGINQLSGISDQVLIYPNPFTDEIIIRINSSIGDLKNWTMQLTDVLGRTVVSKLSLNYNNVIGLSNLPTGVYFIRIVTKSGEVGFPIVKQN